MKIRSTKTMIEVEINPILGLEHILSGDRVNLTLV